MLFINLLYVDQSDWPIQTVIVQVCYTPQARCVTYAYLLPFQAQKAMLQEKVLKKQEEEARRKEELERKKQQEILLKKQRREERARKVAEKQAALKIENEMKKMNAVGVS